MELIKLVLAATAIWALFAFVFTPLIRRRLSAAHIVEKPRFLAFFAATETITGIAFWLMLSVIIAFGIVLYLTSISPTTAIEAQRALEQVRTVSEAVSTMSDHWGILASAIAIFALIIWSYRRTRRVANEQLSENVNAELEGVIQEGLDGELKERVPGPALQQLLGAISERRAALEELQSIFAQDGTDSGLREEIETAQDDLERLNTLATHTDALERTYERLNEKEVAHQSDSKPSRLVTFFASEGMLKSMSAGLKIATIAVCLLTIPASLVITGSNISDSLRVKTKILTEDVRNFQMVAQVLKAKNDFDTSAGKATEFAHKLEPEDEAAADGLARIFESEVVPGHWASSAARASTRTLSRIAAQNVRNKILKRHAATNPALSARGARPSGNRAAIEAETLLRRSVNQPGPLSPVGRLAAAENRRIAKRYPKLWAQMRASYKSYASSFGRLATPQQIRGLVVTQAIGDIISVVPGQSGSEIGKQAHSAFSSMTSDAAKTYVDAAHQRFSVEIGNTGNVPEAATKASQMGQFATPPDTNYKLRRLAERTPDSRTAARRASNSRTALYVSQHGAASGQSTAALRSYIRANAGRRPQNLAASLVSYEDYFPGRPGDEQRSRRASVARALKLQGAPPLPGRESVSYARRSRAMAARAVSYVKLRGFARVGGVLIGRTPNKGSVETEYFRWSIDNRGFRFLIKAQGGQFRDFGPFNPAITNLALVYAADGRPTTVTMVTAQPLRDLKILTHPALVDTGMGCAARRLDQFVDEITSENAVLKELRKKETTAAEAEISLYRLSRALRITSMASNPKILESLRDIGATPLVEAAKRDAQNRRLVADAIPALGKTGPMMISRKPQYFDKSLVKHISSCKQRNTIKGFVRCIQPKLASRTVSARDKRLDWLAPVPTYQVWSGVRELPWKITHNFEFLKVDKNGTAPFRFVVQVAIDSPPYFLPGADAWYLKDNAKIDEYVDSKPWEFTRTGQLLVPAISDGISKSAERRTVFHQMQQFALLQRFFSSGALWPVGP